MTRSQHSGLLTPAIALFAGTAIACAVGIRQKLESRSALKRWRSVGRLACTPW
jgi:hypothetical protein